MDVVLKPRVLLAKTPLDDKSVRNEETLAGHLLKTQEAFGSMFGTNVKPTRLCQSWLRFFRIQDKTEPFLRNMPAVCYLHDIGKANSGFQDAVRGKTGFQVIRHEHLTGLLLLRPEIRQLLQQWGLDTNIVVSAIIGHHLKTCHENFAKPLTLDRKIFCVYSKEIGDLLASVGHTYDTGSSFEATIPGVWSFGADPGCFDPEILISQVKLELSRFRRRLDQDTSEHRLLMATRSALILADSAASGLVRERKNSQEWLETAFDEKQLLDGNAVEEKVIVPRVAQITKERGGFEWQDFQMAADQLPERTLLLASCGSGKTLAAWRWIRARAIASPVARVIFLYPTRGTATEGFRDYVSWAPEADAALLHGTSTYELDGMFNDPKDVRSGKDFTAEDRLFAIAYWQRRVFSATVDQFLGFMQHVYRSTCLMPLLADSVIVFDEVHSFDNSLFSALKRFLQNFDVPVLCMTASLPQNRQQDLRDCGLTIFPHEKNQFADLQRKAEMPRYQVQRIGDEDRAREIALSGFREGKRVLWVVNTVARCQSLAAELEALCYHSRFRLEDRRRHHDKVIAAFRPDKEAVLAITTQVCEMSLDLDADVLITEIAPITSLIQRMGRCNRFARPEQNKIGQVFFYAPQDEKPYSVEELSGVPGFLNSIDGNRISQYRLEELLEEFGPSEVEVERYASFLDSGPWAMSGEEKLRDENEFTVESILDCDIEQYLQLKLEHKSVDGLILPIPRRFASRDSRILNLYIASGSKYSPDYGFLG